MTALLVGFGLGFLVAAQLGPISLLAIRSTLRNGVMVGAALAAAASTAGAGVLAFGGLLAYRTVRD